MLVKVWNIYHNGLGNQCLEWPSPHPCTANRAENSLGTQNIISWEPPPSFQPPCFAQGVVAQDRFYCNDNSNAL